MKKIVLYFVAFVLVTVMLFSGAFISKFTATSENGNVTIEWRTNTETNVKYYEIERRSGNSDVYISIVAMSPTGDNSTYQYVDKTAYKTVDAVYIYRLKIVDINPNVSPTYTNQIAITHRVSSVKSTWGSIKSMFR